MFDCPMGVWVIEQRAIILSATVRSPTVRVYLTYMYKYDILCISDSMLSENIANNIKINGYQIPFRRDRDHNGGRLLTYFFNDMMVKRRDALESWCIETLWTEVSTRGLTFLVCNTVIAIDHQIQVPIWGKCSKVNWTALIKYNKNVLILVDLNADLNITPGRFLYSFTQQNYMQIHIDEHTRYTAESRTCLDQIVSNMPYL